MLGYRSMMHTANDRSSDEHFIRRAIQLAFDARERGDHPFGALLVSAGGEVLAEAMNTVGTLGDRTGHAERNLMSDVSMRFSEDELATATMYTSTEPCAMCAAAVFWTGVTRVVFGCGEDTLRTFADKSLSGTEMAERDSEPAMLALPCRDVFAAGNRVIDVVGPVLPVEASEPHRGFW